MRGNQHAQCARRGAASEENSARGCAQDASGRIGERKKGLDQKWGAGLSAASEGHASVALARQLTSSALSGREDRIQRHLHSTRTGHRCAARERLRFVAFVCSERKSIVLYLQMKFRQHRFDLLFPFVCVTERSLWRF